MALRLAAASMLTAFRPHWPQAPERAEIATLKHTQGSLEHRAHDPDAHLKWEPDQIS